MKKNSIIKAIAITFGIYVILSWIIPGGSFSSGEYVKGSTSPVGIGNLFTYPVSTFLTSICALIGVNILLIGGLYGVMNKTGAYQKLVDGTVKKFVGKEKKFLIISVVVFALLASLTTLTLPLLILVPFFVAVILLLGFNKMTALLSTIGAILVGNMATISGYNMDGYSYMNLFFGLKTADNILYKIILFVVLVAIMLYFVLKTSKVEKAKSGKKILKKKDEETKEDAIVPLYKKGETTKKSSIGLVVVFCLGFIIALVSMFNWAGAFGVEKTIFDTWHTNIMDVKLNGYPIFANILGSINPFGYWSNYDLAMLLLILIVVMGLVYKLKISEIFESAVEGMKEVVSVAFAAVLANILLLIVNTVTDSFMITIFDRINHLPKKVTPLSIGLISTIGSVGYSDFPYLVNAIYNPIVVSNTESVKEIAYIMQIMYGFTMLLVPTSVGLVVGLQYLNISFKEWFKENWKLFLSILAASIILMAIVVLL